MPIDNHVADIPLWIRDYPGGEAIYRAGLAAGIERAAKVCEDDIGISAAALRGLLK